MKHIMRHTGDWQWFTGIRIDHKQLRRRGASRLLRAANAVDNECVDIIGHARIIYVGKSQSCMLAK